MMLSKSIEKPRFLRRTTLRPDEYRTNFRQIDCDIIEAISSDEASRITPQMCRIYLRLVQAPSQYWEREGVLRFTGDDREGEWLTGWDHLIGVTGVASATARKALAWMNDQGIIGYFAGKNGVGIRIFLNRAASSIRERPPRDQKNLRLVRTSTEDARASSVETPFKESFAQREDLEKDIVPHAPARAGLKSGSIETIAPEPVTDVKSCSGRHSDERVIVERIVAQIAPQLKTASEREHERTRQWFIDCALPKAIRVAQRSAYDILRANDAVARTSGDSRRAKSDNSRVGANPKSASVRTGPLTEREIDDIAEGCAAIFFAQGKELERTLAEIVSAGQGFLSMDEIARVRARARILIGEVERDDVS